MVIIEEKIQIGGIDHFPIPLDLAAKFAECFNFSFQIKMGPAKFVKIQYDEKSSKENIEKYKNKGLEKLYLQEGDYKLFLSNIRTKIQEVKNEGSEEKKVSTLNAAYEEMKNAFINYGVNEEVVELGREIVKEGMEIISTSQNLAGLLKRFRGECEEEFIRQIFKGYICAAVVNQFSWGSEAMKEKITLACVLTDITLDSTDFKTLEKKDINSKDFQRLINHPLEVGRILRDSKKIEKETIEIIECHHEKPNGRGFPRGLDYKNIGLLSGIYITVSDFVERAIQTDFDDESRLRIINDFLEFYPKGHFQEVCEKLFKLF